ncbi:hypothetical protein Tco_0089425 [Tanacetum coccineum]
MIKSLANKLYLKKKLSTFYMLIERKISEHINEFNKIVVDLANIEVKFKDEGLDLLLLTSLPASYDHFVNTLLYGREALTLEDVMATLNSKEIKERSKAKEDNGEWLTDRRDSHKSRGKSRSKSRGDDGDECRGSARLDHGFRRGVRSGSVLLCVLYVSVEIYKLQVVCSSSRLKFCSDTTCSIYQPTTWKSRANLQP